MSTTIKDIEELLALQAIQFKDIKRIGKKQLFIVTTKHNEKQEIFYSYKRQIGYIRGDKVYITYPEGWSLTTQKHIKHLLKHYNKSDIIRY